MSRVMVRRLGPVVAGLVLLGVVLGPLSGPVAAEAAPALLVQTIRETIGTPVPGSYVTADLGRWAAPGPASYEFQWLRDGSPIAGATARDYLVQAADIGHQLAPQVTGERDGYDPATFTGPPLIARKLTSTVTLEVHRAVPPHGTRKVWVAVATVHSERPIPIVGAVHVLEGKAMRGLASGPVSRDVAAIKLPGRKIKPGRHRVGACFLGSDVLEASCSGSVFIHVPARRHRR